MVAGLVEDAAVVRRKDDREGPREAVSHVPGSDPGGFLGPDIDQLDLPGTMVVTLQRPRAARAGADRTAINDVRILGMHGNKAAFPGARVGAVAEGDRTPNCSARCRNTGVVLLRGIHAVRVLVVGVDAIELRGRLVVDRRPGLAAVEADAGAAIVALDHSVRIGRIDPEIMIIAVRRLDLREASAAIGRFP